jgi:hypothetical protein
MYMRSMMLGRLKHSTSRSSDFGLLSKSGKIRIPSYWKYFIIIYSGGIILGSEIPPPPKKKSWWTSCSMHEKDDECVIPFGLCFWRKRPFWRSRHRWLVNIKMKLKKIICELDSFAKEFCQWRARMNTVIPFSILFIGNLLNSWASVSFSRTMFHWIRLIDTWCRCQKLVVYDLDKHGYKQDL